MSNSKEWIVGTRGSRLAMWQTEHVVAELRRLCPERSFKIQKIKTAGDKDQTSFLTGLRNTQFFTKELDDALQAGEIDLAVHSLKDIVLELPDDISIGAAIERNEHRDAFISRDGTMLMDLKPGAVIGTGSVRRRAFLRKARPDLEFAEIRGNLDTRLRKLDQGQFDAIVLAACGLIRLGWGERITQLLDHDVILPAAGQGSIAVTVRSGDKEVGDAVALVNHKKTYIRVQAERIFLGALCASCRFPLGVIADVRGHTLTIKAAAYAPDGTGGIKRIAEGPAENYEDMARSLAGEFKAAGIDELVAS